MNMDCKTAVEKLYQYLDRELEDDEYEEVQRHLDACPPCAQFFKFEQGLLTTVGDICRQERAPAGLVDKVLNAQTSRIS